MGCIMSEPTCFGLQLNVYVTLYPLRQASYGCIQKVSAVFVTFTTGSAEKNPMMQIYQLGYPFRVYFQKGGFQVFLVGWLVQVLDMSFYSLRSSWSFCSFKSLCKLQKQVKKDRYESKQIKLGFKRTKQVKASQNRSKQVKTGQSK